MSSFRSIPSNFTIQMETDEEREALIINTGEHIVARKVSLSKILFSPFNFFSIITKLNIIEQKREK